MVQRDDATILADYAANTTLDKQKLILEVLLNIRENTAPA
jgi:hypothetical protein